MNLKSQVTAHLRNGSINVPGKDAVNVLASRLGRKKSDVKNVLVALMDEGTLDLAGGNVHHTSFIALRLEFRPRTEQGRKESKYATYQDGRHIPGIATGGPVTVRQATLEEWVRMGNDASTYTFGTPANEIPAQEATPIMDADVPKPADALGDQQATQLAVQKLQTKTLENIEKLRQMITKEAALSVNGLIPSELFRETAAHKLGVGNATMVKYLSLLKKEGFCTFVQFERSYHIKLVTGDEQPASAGVVRKPRPAKQEAKNQRTVNKLAKINELKALIGAEAEKSSGGLIPSEAFRLLAVKELGVSLSTINNYIKVLTDGSFVDYTRNGVQNGMVYIKLVEKLDAEAKLNAVLELLRTLKRKRNSRLPLKDEVAKLLNTTPASADAGFLSPLRWVGAYKTERQGSGHLFDYKLVYVQKGPVTEGQMADIRELRRSKKKGADEQPGTDAAPEATDELELPAQQPPVALTDGSEDEITTLISGLVDTNEAQAAELARLNADNASLAQHLASEVDRLTMVNNLLEQQLIEALEKRDFYHVLAEAERTRDVSPKAPTISALPQDLLQRARAALVTNKEQSSAPS